MPNERTAEDKKNTPPAEVEEGGGRGQTSPTGPEPKTAEEVMRDELLDDRFQASDN